MIYTLPIRFPWVVLQFNFINEGYNAEMAKKIYSADDPTVYVPEVSFFYYA